MKYTFLVQIDITRENYSQTRAKLLAQGIKRLLWYATENDIADAEAFDDAVSDVKVKIGREHGVIFW